MKFLIASMITLAFFMSGVAHSQAAGQWRNKTKGVLDIVDASYELGHSVGINFYVTGITATPFVKYTKGNNKETGDFGACFEDLKGDGQGNLVAFRFRAEIPDTVKSALKLAPQTQYLVIENSITPDSGWKTDCSNSKCITVQGWTEDQQDAHILQLNNPRIMLDELASRSLSMNSRHLLLRWSRYDSYKCAISAQ